MKSPETLLINYDRKGEEIDSDLADKAVEQYMDKIADDIRILKAGSDNPHFEYLDPDRLEVSDKMIFDKLQKGKLNEGSDEFKNYCREIDRYVARQGESFDVYKDPRVNLLGYVRNRLLGQALEKRRQGGQPGN